MCNPRPIGLLALLACVLMAWAARADGPHWHVPNPDGEDFTEDEAANKGNKAPAVAAKGGQAGGKAVAGDYMQNPGNFLLMDPKCIDYYERHCVIKHPGAGKDLEFYLLIMNRCAQAMREVDSYLPCPDSFPLWHTEELRELMLEFARRTWIRSTQLNAADAEACAKFCVECFVDTVRFANVANENAFGAKLKEAFDGNKKMHELLEKMSNEKDQGKKGALWKECGQILNGAGISRDLHKALLTFKLMTGDIPPQVDEAQMRMEDALLSMGTIVLKPLMEYTKDKSVRVQQAVWMLIGTLQKRMANPMKLAPSMSTVLEQLRWLANKPNTAEAQMAAKILKGMGNAALPYLLQAAKSDTLNLKPVALAQLSAVSGKGLGGDLAKWQEYVDSLGGKPAAAEPAKAEK